MPKQIPPEIVTDILSRLPVKSLLRFRSVSKPFCSQIDGHDFIKHHLTHSVKTHTNLSLILTDTAMHETIVSFNFDSLNNPVVLKNPLKCPNWYDSVKVVGTCNGLLCLSGSNGGVALFNTATRKHHVLPHLDQELLKDQCCGGVWVYGLGYDPSIDDYKVVRIAQFSGFDGKCLGCEVRVYSLKTNAWRKVREDFPYALSYTQKMGVLASGNLHLEVAPISQLGMSVKDNIIVGFDLGVENYKEVPLPDFVVKTNVSPNLAVLAGCLCMVPICNDKVRGDVWMMKEYGVKESWTKLFSLVPQGRISSFKDVFPVAYSKKGDEVLLEVDDKSLFWYDLKKKQMRSVKMRNGPLLFVADVIVNSLVSLKIGKATDGKKQQVQKGKKQQQVEEGKKNRKKRDDFLSKGFKLVL